MEDLGGSSGKEGVGREENARYGNIAHVKWNEKNHNSLAYWAHWNCIDAFENSSRIF